MKRLKINQRKYTNEVFAIIIQCIAILIMFVGFLAFTVLTGCATNKQKDPEIVFKTVNRPVPVLPLIPKYLLQGYRGEYPIATPEGEICFAGDEIRNLQELIQFLNNQNRSLKELLR